MRPDVQMNALIMMVNHVFASTWFQRRHSHSLFLLKLAAFGKAALSASVDQKLLYWDDSWTIPVLSQLLCGR